jgi:hypothetical protein
MSEDQWGANAKMVLRSLSTLEEGVRGVDTRLTTVSERLSVIEERLERSLQNGQQLHKDVDSLKMFRVQAMAVFAAVQFVFGLVIALKDKLFGK